jgi:hypothetical protein
MTAVPDDFDALRADITAYEKEAMEISSPLALGRGTASGVSKEKLIHLVGLLFKLSSAYKNYTRLLEQSLVDIRDNMGQGEGAKAKKTLEDTAMNLDRLIDSLQKIEDVTSEFEK